MTYQDEAGLGQRQMYAGFMGVFSLVMAALWVGGMLIMLAAAYKGSTTNDVAAAIVDTNAEALATQ